MGLRTEFIDNQKKTKICMHSDLGKVKKQCEENADSCKIVVTL